MEKILNIYGEKYKVKIIKKTYSTVEGVKIIIPVYAMNQIAFDMAKVCIESIKKYTVIDHEIWVVDNNSLSQFSNKLQEIDDINIAVNQTTPINYQKISSTNIIQLIKNRFIFQGTKRQIQDGSYANAVGLEIGCQLIDPNTKYVFTMHSDILVLKNGWLQFLLNKLDDNVKAVACWRDNIRVKALHIGGLLFDYQLFKKYNISFMSNIGKLNDKHSLEYDVGDLLTLKFHENGHGTYVCKNTYNEPKLVDLIPDSNPMKNIHSDRVFDDNNELIYAHLGRGTRKSFDIYKKSYKTYPQEWKRYAYEHVL